MCNVHKQDMCGHHSSVYHMRKQGNKCTYSVLLPERHRVRSVHSGGQLTCLHKYLAHLPRNARAVGLGRDLWDRGGRLSEVHACMKQTICNPTTTKQASQKKPATAKLVAVTTATLIKQASYVVGWRECEYTICTETLHGQLAILPAGRSTAPAWAARICRRYGSPLRWAPGVKQKRHNKGALYGKTMQNNTSNCDHAFGLRTHACNMHTTHASVSTCERTQKADASSSAQGDGGFSALSLWPAAKRLAHCSLGWEPTDSKNDAIGAPNH